MSDGVRALTALKISPSMSWSLYAPVVLLCGVVAVALMEDPTCAFSGLPFWVAAVPVLAAAVPVLAAAVPVLAAAVPVLAAAVPVLAAAVPALAAVVPALAAVVPVLAAAVPALVALDCSGYTALLSRKPATTNRTYSSVVCIGCRLYIQ